MVKEEKRDLCATVMHVISFKSIPMSSVIFTPSKRIFLKKETIMTCTQELSIEVYCKKTHG